MPPASATYRYLRQTRLVLRTIAPITAVVIFGYGLAMFGNQASKLLTTNYGQGERIVTGLWALYYLGGPGLLAFLVHRFLRSSSDLIDLWIDQAEATQRQVTILQEELAPAIRRLTNVLETLAQTDFVDPSAAGRRPHRPFQG